MKILITGGGGQVARALSAAAPAEWSVSAPARAELDILDQGALRDLMKRSRPDVVINTAAYTAVDRAETVGGQAWRVNRDGAANIAIAASGCGARVVHLSTDYIFDGRSHRPYRPDDQTNPLSVYGASKLAGERAVAEVAPDALIVRTSWVYSAGPANFLAAILARMTTGMEVRVVDDQIGTPTSAASLAGALWDLIARNASGVFHYTDAGVASWYDFACAIGDEAVAAGMVNGRPTVAPIPSHERPSAAARPAYSVLDKSATWRLLGGPSPHWRQALHGVFLHLTT